MADIDTIISGYGGNTRADFSKLADIHNHCRVQVLRRHDHRCVWRSHHWRLSI
jgi:hypothetical protein